jgi:type VI protein secretion system component VasK
LTRLLLAFNGYILLFGAVAVAAFWFAIQLFWSVARKPWYSVVARLVGALVLLGLGVVMIFFTAFGS